MYFRKSDCKRFVYICLYILDWVRRNYFNTVKNVKLISAHSPWHVLHFSVWFIKHCKAQLWKEVTGNGMDLSALWSVWNMCCNLKRVREHSCVKLCWLRPLTLRAWLRRQLKARWTMSCRWSRRCRYLLKLLTSPLLLPAAPSGPLNGAEDRWVTCRPFRKPGNLSVILLQLKDLASWWFMPSSVESV